MQNGGGRRMDGWIGLMQCSDIRALSFWRSAAADLSAGANALGSNGLQLQDPTDLKDGGGGEPEVAFVGGL